jgi:sugar/nucleoside kinase (ribokinase family)
MKTIDVIGIGAINYDYICEYDPAPYESRSLAPEVGSEDLGSNDKDKAVAGYIYDRIAKTESLITEVGGSAYLAIKTISIVEPELKTAYVGVFSQPQSVEKKANFTLDPKVDFGYLTDTDWLFEDKDGPPGRALVQLSRGLRQHIEIGPGCNTALREKILKKENESQESFTKYLANARWVHLTSFSNFDQFEFFIDRVEEAKKINPCLLFSIDPGAEYTSKYTDRLTKAFSIADYVFLTESEFDKVKRGHDFPWRARLDAVGAMMEKNSQVLIVKSPNNHILVNLLKGKPLNRTFWHPRLLRGQIRNDTGAGDVFAGGVIAGLLSPSMLTHQPAPIRLGANLAAIRLKSGCFPVDQLKATATSYFQRNQRNEHDNFRQRIQVLWETGFGIFVSMSISFVTGVLVAWLFS